MNKKPKVSIIMPCRFRSDLTKVAIDSIFEYTPENFELILVQEGNEPGMDEVLKEYKAKRVYHLEPQGYPKAINAGYKEISKDSEYVVFLNSDVVCTPGWLAEMIEAFKKDPKIGLVVPTLTFSDSAAWQGVDRNKKGEDYTFVEEIKGVCVVFKRSVCEELINKNKEFNVQGEGVLDERFGLGGGDDNDLCAKLKRLDYKIIIARKSFIYHYNSASFREVFDNDFDRAKKYSTEQFYKFKNKDFVKNTSTDKPRIYIAVKAIDGKWQEELAIRLIEWSHDPSIIVKIKSYSHNAPGDTLRNQAVKDFLEEYFEYFLMCFKGETLIETKEGGKKIKDIKIGEYVKTHKNRWRKVIKLYERHYPHQRPLIWLKTKNSIIKSTPEHPFLALRNGKIKWIKIKDLYITDNLLYPVNNQLDYLSFNCWGNLHYSKNKRFAKSGTRNKNSKFYGQYLVNEDLARFLGLYLAEGCGVHDGICFTFNNKENNLINFIEKFCIEKFNRKSTISTRWATTMKLNIRSFSNLFISWFGKYATEKRIPEFVFNWNLKNKLAFLNGYIDGDGHKRKDCNSIAIQTASKKLSEDFNNLCLSCGLSINKINFYGAKKTIYNHQIINSGESYLIYINKNSWGKFLDILEGQMYQNKFILIPINDLINKKQCSNAVKDMKVYNLEIEEDNSYIANSVIVHNCDNDITPPPDALHKLLMADKEIIAPVCFTLKPDTDGVVALLPVAYRYNEEGKYKPYYGTGVEETDIVTGGMHLVKREVFEKMDRPYEYEYHANGIKIYSDDFMFSRKCKALGYRLYTHYDVICGHWKEVNLKSFNDLLLKVTQEKIKENGN